MKNLKTLYGVPQEILYTVCVAAWKLCSANLAKFTALKALYTEAFVTESLNHVQATKDLPDTRQTIADRKEARINLLADTRQVRLTGNC